MSLFEQLKRHEGWRDKPYIDTVGVATFGYGFTYLTEAEGEFILRNRIETYTRELFARFPWVENLSPTRQDVLINMTYNLGIERLSGFVNFLRFVKRGEWDQAAEAMLDSKWASQVHGRATELAQQMRTGVR